MSDVSQQYNDVTKELYQNQLKLTEAQTKGEAASKGMDETYQKLLSTLGRRMTNSRKPTQRENACGCSP